jgi:NTE family protein
VREKAFGVALAGGGPLGAIYEVGVMVALEEALRGVDLTRCDAYVGVSAGGFMAAGLANGFTPRELHKLFIESDAFDDPFEPDLLLSPALHEYARRLFAFPGLFAQAAQHYFADPFGRGVFESFTRLARALPAGMFDNARIGDWLAKHFSQAGRTNDFRALKNKLFLVATDLDTAEAVSFGAPGWDHVPISRAVQASAALPGLFPPVEIDGRHYVDGALKKTLHASVALREGVKLLICVNPLVPFDANLAAYGAPEKRLSLVDFGLPVVLSQTFRAIIHSRMRVGMERYAKQFPDADVVLFEPSRGDAELFFTNVFSYSGRRRLSEHAYQHTRAELLRRYDELSAIFAPHGVTIDRAALIDDERTLLDGAPRSRRSASAANPLAKATDDLGGALDRIDAALQGARRTP